MNMAGGRPTSTKQAFAGPLKGEQQEYLPAPVDRGGD
jgi:hypothetical protein